MKTFKTKTSAAAAGRWPYILSVLGIEAAFLRNCHGPCPMCGGKDRFRFDDREGRGTWFCSKCRAGDGFDLLKNLFGWRYAHAAKEVDRVLDTAPATPITRELTHDSKRAALRAACKASRPVERGDPVWQYLNQTRQLGVDEVPANLRFHPGMRHSEGNIYP